jgi:hypothetical protein
MYVDMNGAASGGGGAADNIPGYGASVQSYLSVIPGTVLHVSVGCQGISCPAAALTVSTYVAGGYNGGGSAYSSSGFVGSTSGGGASDIRIGGISLYDRVIVAGGGGGYYCNSECGAQKGGDGGKYGKDGFVSTLCIAAGHRAAGGGNWTSGGAAGGSAGAPNPTRGTLGIGGNGGFGSAGGGGGGYYGGKNCNYRIK